MDLATIELIAGMTGVYTAINYIIIKYYNGKMKDLKEDISDIKEKIDTIIKEQNNQNQRISRLEEDVKWLINLNRK